MMSLSRPLQVEPDVAAEVLSVKAQQVGYLVTLFQSFLLGLAIRADGNDAASVGHYASVLRGGSGTIRGTLVGCVFTGIILNAMTLMGVNDYWQYIVRGALVVFAVFLNTMVKDRLKEKGY